MLKEWEVIRKRNTGCLCDRMTMSCAKEERNEYEAKALLNEEHDDEDWGSSCREAGCGGEGKHEQKQRKKGNDVEIVFRTQATERKKRSSNRVDQSSSWGPFCNHYPHGTPAWMLLLRYSLSSKSQSSPVLTRERRRCQVPQEKKRKVKKKMQARLMVKQEELTMMSVAAVHHLPDHDPIWDTDEGKKFLLWEVEIPKTIHNDHM